ncbi:MAG: Xaa-Pro peptidase family protein [Coriobacteriia bacterium]|nr:Xaa-Pro peptidase family protein [Coriobacteriia bacterium]
MGTDERLQRTNEALGEHELDAYLATHTSDIRWLTGFSHVFDDEAAHAMLVTSDRLTKDPLRLLHTDMRYSGAMKPLSSGVLDVLDDERKSHSLFIVEQLKAINVSLSGVNSPTGLGLAASKPLRIGIEADILLTFYRSLVKAFDEADLGSYELVEVPSLVTQLRAVKDASEIASMKESQKITDAAYTYLLDYIKAGQTEFEIATELDFFMRRQGSEGVSFGSIVGSGPNSANPHAVPGSRQIQTGDMIVLDFGAKLDDYRSDMTRTVAVGKASARQREIYETVLEAQLATLGTVKAGIPNAEPYQRVNEIFAAKGYGPLTHGLGHGVGIDIHESPTLAAGVEGELQVGHVVTVEPGIYLEGDVGVRIEDFGAITAEGIDNFTASTKELIEL